LKYLKLFERKGAFIATFVAKKANIFCFFSLFFLRKNENFEWKIACNFFDFFYVFLIVLLALGNLVCIFFFLESL